MNDNSQPATKGDLLQLEVRIDKKLDDLERRMDAKLDSMMDQILRAFQMTEEKIRQDAAHVDELAALDQRVTRLEQEVGVQTS